MLTHRFEDALVFAAQAHQKQRRKGSEVPYVSHLLGVCSLVLEHGGSEDQAIAALLHDAVEDQGGGAMLEVVRTRFGDRVAAVVAGCSEIVEPIKPRWIERKRQYIERIHEAPPEVKLVSCADKVHNVRHILVDLHERGEAVLDRFSKGKLGTVWYYRALVDAYETSPPTPPAGLLAELGRCVAELERITGITGRGVDWSVL